MNVNSLYDQGYVFTRLGRGVMQQTRSVRIGLSQFFLSSENRRVLKNNSDLDVALTDLPYAEYHWSIGKMAKDFYETKFGSGIMSANKMKELLTNEEKSNFNRLFIYTRLGAPIGYSVAYETDQIIHYSYPFYGLQTSDFRLQNIGMAMMLLAILYAKDHGKRYIYLGSAQRPTDTYKLQFAGFEWFDGAMWQKDHEALKAVLKK